MTIKRGTKDAGLLTLFSFSLFLSAGLMFAVQPMVGKMLLPLVGGTPAGWVVAMAFFQLALLLGYLLAHLLSKFPVRVHGALFLAALAAGFLFLPVNLKDHISVLGETPGPFSVFLLLSIATAAPFIALSTSAPTLQRLFSATGHPDAKDPYFLYAASNLGSFIGLFSYPLLIEPLSTLSQQTHGWQIGFAGLALIGILCLIFTKGQKNAPVATTLSETKITWPRRLRWLLLAFVPSSLMLGVTTHITTDVLSAPMLWVVPLGIYLISFIFVFSPKNPVPHDKIVEMHPIFISGTIGFIAFMLPVYYTWSVLILHIATFAIVAMLCHKQLADDRPAARHLTEFYLLMSIGGALGGVLNAFIAPLIFSFQLEYPAILLFSCFLNPRFEANFWQKKYYDWLIMGAICIAFYFIAGGIWPEFKNGPVLSSLMLVSFVLLTLHPRFALMGGIVAIGFFYYNNFSNTIYRDRNFFGIVRVFEKTEMRENIPYVFRFLAHGTTTHGYQITSDEKFKNKPLAYYTDQGPVGGIFSAFHPRNIGVIGLGTGTMACHTAPGRHYTYYEIDPVVVHAAQTYFTFLQACAPDAKIILGDARLELARDKSTKYDMLVLDAFSSDMIPMHLLTKEAFEVYLDRIANNGIILLHLSNRFLDLELEAAATSKLLGLKHLFVRDMKPENPFAYAGKWMVVARPNVDLSALKIPEGWHVVTPPEGFRPWTDDYSNFMSVIRFKL